MRWGITVHIWLLFWASSLNLHVPAERTMCLRLTSSNVGITSSKQSSAVPRSALMVNILQAPKKKKIPCYLCEDWRLRVNACNNTSITPTNLITLEVCLLNELETDAFERNSLEITRQVEMHLFIFSINMVWNRKVKLVLWYMYIKNL